MPRHADKSEFFYVCPRTQRVGPERRTPRHDGGQVPRPQHAPSAHHTRTQPSSRLPHRDENGLHDRSDLSA